MRARACLPVSLLLVFACSQEPEEGPSPSEQESGFEPVAVGFEFDGAIRSDGTISSYTALDGAEVPPTVTLRLGGWDFFYAGDVNQSCEAWGEWAPALREEPLPTASGTPVWNSYEGPLRLQHHDCLDLTEAWGADGERVDEILSGMRLGIAFGPLTDALRDSLPESWQVYNDALMTMFVAVNDADGRFVGHDRTLAILYDWDENTGDLVTGEEDLLMLKVVKDWPPGQLLPEGWVWSAATRFEQLSQLDHDELKHMPE